MHWCDKCRKYHDDFKTLKKEKEKKGHYHPYRDTMESETYIYTEVTKKCNVCGDIIKVEEDKDYKMSPSRMQKYGYRNSHYDT